mgnify:CR=1 FL=1
MPIIAGWTHGIHPAKKDHVCCIRIGILTHFYIIKNVKILELNKNKFNTPLFFGRTFVLLKTHLP